MSKEKIYIFDTTLRDGAQTEGVDFSIEDKNKIAKVKVVKRIRYFPNQGIDITKDSNAAEYVMSVNGGKRIIPTFIIDSKIYTNPGIQELSKLIMQ